MPRNTEGHTSPVAAPHDALSAELLGQSACVACEAPLTEEDACRLLPGDSHAFCPACLGWFVEQYVPRR